MLDTPLAFRRHGYALHVDPRTGRGRLLHRSGGQDDGDDAPAPLWTGTVHPAFWVQAPSGDHRLLLTEGVGVQTADGVHRVQLDVGGAGTGQAVWRETDAGLELAELEVEFESDGFRIIDLFFGVRPLTAEETSAAPDLSLPFWPDWRAEGFCVPSGRPAPAASFFRNWDLGQASIQLGNFGPAMSSPYAAAFPRPLYAAAMGDDRGWLVAGPGELPDGALSLEIRSTSGALRSRLREDLWGAPTGTAVRRWESPLRLAWASTAWDAYAAHFATFDSGRQASPVSVLSAWNTWGDWKNGRRTIFQHAERAAEIECEMFVLDDGWETQMASGQPNTERFPHFDRELEKVRGLGMVIGFWEAVGWIEDPAAVGLRDEDLLRGLDGRPRRANWAADPRAAKAHFCLDPSSQRTREFLVERTKALVSKYDPALLKIDFSYGLPGPDVAAPADPALRGERLGHELNRIVTEAARESKPDIAVMVYGIHPLHVYAADLVSLDDMGDHGAAYEGQGHRHWSVWAALLAGSGKAINGAGGYDWQHDDEVVLDTAVLGAPGAPLPLWPETPGRVPGRKLARRRALNRWHRRTLHWRPLWLNSDVGSLVAQPQLRCCGRLEPSANGEVLTALCLRDGPDRLTGVARRTDLSGLDHAGRWAVLAQDDDDLLRGNGTFAAIPFDGGWLTLPCEQPPSRVRRFADRREDAAGWDWQDGTLRLACTEQDIEAGLEGWLVVKTATSKQG